MTEMTKQDALRVVEAMPDDSTLEEILYNLYVHAQIERGLEDIRRGRTVTHEEVMREVGEWLRQKAGDP